MDKIRCENLKAYLNTQKGAATLIAKQLNVSKGLVSHWKHGIEPVPEGYTEEICSILGRSIDDLCKPFTTFHPSLPDSEEIRLLLKIAPQLSDAGLEQVLQLALQLKRSEQEQKSDS